MGSSLAPLDHPRRDPHGGDVIGDILDDGSSGVDDGTLTAPNPLDDANADPDMRKFPLP